MSVEDAPWLPVRPLARARVVRSPPSDVQGSCKVDRPMERGVGRGRRRGRGKRALQARWRRPMRRVLWVRGSDVRLVYEARPDVLTDRIHPSQAPSDGFDR